MNLLERISIAIRAAAGGLAGGERPTTPQDTQRLLNAAQKRVDRLNDQLAQAEAREKRAEQEWHDARTLADAFEAEVNAAVSAGQDDAARTKLAQFNHAQINVQQLDASWQRYASSSAKLRLEITDLQAQLAVIRRRLGQASVAVTPTMVNLGAGASAPTAATTATTHPTVKPTESVTAPPTTNTETPAPPLDNTRISDLLKKRD
jgi:phage shock protein A